MKIAAPIGLLGLMLCVALTAPASWPAQNETAPTKAVVQSPLSVTRDNFVSLSWKRTGGFAGIYSTVEVTGNVISRPTPLLRNGTGGGGAPTPRVPETRGLSNKQLDELIEKMSVANLPALVGNYHQEGLTDGFNDTLILTLSDENGDDREFAINNYGGTAPKAYLDFITYFQGFVDKKFAPRQTTLLTAIY